MIIRAADQEEYEEIYDLVDKAFNQSKLERNVIAITTNEDPNFHKEDLRVVEVDKKIVSIMMLIRRPLRLGSSMVNGAIVAPVATHPDHQRKNYCSAVMRNAVEYMKAQRFDITILWGNPWLYPHYGYSPAMLKTELVIKPEQSYAEESLCELRSFTEDNLQQITRIYHNNTLMRTCAELRSPTMSNWKPNGPEAKLEVLVNMKDEVIGYCSLGTDWSRPCAHEIGVLNDEACRALFNSIIEIVKNKGLKEFYCTIHPDHPFARFAFWHDSEMRINRCEGAGMARILNLASILEKMSKEFERRISNSELYQLDFTFKITSDEETAFLEFNHGKVSVAVNRIKSGYELDIPLISLNPLITGYKGIRELMKDPNVKVKYGKKALRLIEVLFPTGYPFGGYLPLFWE